MPSFDSKFQRIVFELYVQRVNTAYSNFEGRLADYIQTRIAFGQTREGIIAELLADLQNGSGIFKDLVGQVGYETDFGLNAEYQVASNEDVGEVVKWTLDPSAEHCDSCLHQASLGPRPIEEVPFPGFQPTEGKTNCERYCKCTLEPVK